jgi:carbamoylphosphate synthase large subunit
VLIATWLHWVSAARITAELVAAGVSVDVVCSDFHPVLSVKGISKRHRYVSRAPLESLTRAIERSAPDLVIASDDFAIGHLQKLRSAGRPELAELIERSLGPSASYEIIASRARFIAAAQSAGVDAPDCIEVASVDDLKARLLDFGTPAFLKMDGTCGGDGVKFLRDTDDATAAFDALTGAAGIRQTADAGTPVLSVQKAVAGQPANCAAFAWRGEVLGVVSVVTLQTLREYGIATVVLPVENLAMRNAAASVARELNLSGFFGLDFVLEEGGQRAWVVELNQRPTPISHFALGAGRDLVAALVSKVQGRPVPDRPIAFRADAAVAMFPHLLRDRRAAVAPQEDWPVGQPQLIGAFTRRRRLADVRDSIRNRLKRRPPASHPVGLGPSSEVLPS